MNGVSMRKQFGGSRRTQAARRPHQRHYVDKLDGRVDGAFFDKMSAEWRENQNRYLREIERHEAAEQSYMDEGVQILELARNAQRLFERQEPRQKRRLLNFVLSNWHLGGRRGGRYLPPTI
jgi:hypothetical protein